MPQEESSEPERFVGSAIAELDTLPILVTQPGDQLPISWH